MLLPPRGVQSAGACRLISGTGAGDYPLSAQGLRAGVTGSSFVNCSSQKDRTVRMICSGNLLLPGGIIGGTTHQVAPHMLWGYCQ